MLSSFCIICLIGIYSSNEVQAYEAISANDYYKKQINFYLPVQLGQGPIPIEKLKAEALHEISRGQPISYDKYLKKNNNQSAVVMKDGKLIYERYNDKWSGSPTFPINGQSLTKGITGITVGAVLCSGRIKSLDDKMGQYSETLKNSPYANISIRRALQMRSGIDKYDTKEGAELWWMSIGDEEHGYKGKNHLKDHIKTVKSKNGDGKISEYMPNDSYALSIMVSELTGSSLGANFRDEIFNKIEPTANAYWMIDADGITIPNAGIFLTAWDWAKVGNFVQESINSNTRYPGDCMGQYFTEGIKNASRSSRLKGWKFGYHFWTKKIKSQPVIIFAGYGGQTVYINPKTRTVVMASSVNPKYGNSSVWEQVETVLIKAGKNSSSKTFNSNKQKKESDRNQ
jgi:CubicO group peptidase (beta-lactamase class C family)|tara:strand:+ start:131 stop:1327 length:1197 start_codon:yes stop_codon:yes gene_type:complete